MLTIINGVLALVKEGICLAIGEPGDVLSVYNGIKHNSTAIVDTRVDGDLQHRWLNDEQVEVGKKTAMRMKENESNTQFIIFLVQYSLIRAN